MSNVEKFTVFIITYFPLYTFLLFTTTSRSTCSVPSMVVVCSSWCRDSRYFTQLLSERFWDGFFFSPIFTGITFVFIFHIRCNYHYCRNYTTGLISTQSNWFEDSQNTDRCCWNRSECVMSLYSLTLRWLMSYIYGAPILDVSRSHTTTQHSR